MLAKRRGLNWNLRPPHNCCNCTFDSSCKFYDINVCRCDNFGNGGHDAKQKSQKAGPKAGSVGIESIWIRWLWRAIWISFWINTFPSIHSIHLHMEAAKSVNIQRWKKGLILRCAPPLIWIPTDYVHKVNLLVSQKTETLDNSVIRKSTHSKKHINFHPPAPPSKSLTRLKRGKGQRCCRICSFLRTQ